MHVYFGIGIMIFVGMILAIGSFYDPDKAAPDGSSALHYHMVSAHTIYQKDPE